LLDYARNYGHLVDGCNPLLDGEIAQGFKFSLGGGVTIVSGVGLIGGLKWTRRIYH
jgi:hypothetical protein